MMNAVAQVALHRAVAQPQGLSDVRHQHVVVEPHHHARALAGRQRLEGGAHVHAIGDLVVGERLVRHHAREHAKHALP
jgi:hypothetical protein